MRQKRKPKKKKPEWSKIFASAIAFLFGVVGIWATVRFYQLTELAITEQSTVAPDPGVAVAYISMVIASLMSYLLYQAGLKNSRNKYGIDPEGQPYKQKNEAQSVEEAEAEESAEG